MKHIPKYLFLLLGTLTVLNGILASVFVNWNVGILLTYFLGIFFLVVGCLWKLVQKHLPKWVLHGFCVLIALGFSVILAFYLYGNFDTTTYTEDAVIVLGAGIRKQEVTKDLSRRLDAAIRYYENNPSAVIVVSGGQGHGEDITEALAMERYLVEKGIPKEKIIKEERSTSTVENFRYCKEILDGYFEGDYRVAFVTSDFHIFRAKQLAAYIGFSSPTHTHSTTPWYTVLPNGLRECLGMVKMWLIDQRT